MDYLEPISIAIQGPPVSGASSYFTKASQRSKTVENDESDLLRSIRAALRGSGTDAEQSPQSTVYLSNEEPFREEELSWDSQTVVLSEGGVIRKKWSFIEEGQPVQWACIGWLELPGPVSSTSATGPGHYTSQSRGGPVVPAESSQRPVFGPFARAQQTKKREMDPGCVVRGVFIFLRCIGQIFLMNGLEYTFSLPFVVRRAWPVFPHGVMIQRVLDDAEVEEAEASGDAPLPTLFSFTNPFAEAAPVGLTSGIIGGFDCMPISLRDEDENSRKPLKSIPADELVLWVSHRIPHVYDDVLVTFDPQERNISIWRYAYIKPKDTPIPLGRSKARKSKKKRTPVVTKLADGENQPRPASPDASPNERSPTPEVQELPPLSALPGMPPSLSSTTTMASLMAGASSSASQLPGPNKIHENLRNDHSITMDRMVLGGRVDFDAGLLPPEHGRMRAAYWMEKVYTHHMPEIDPLSWPDISVSLFDQRFDGKINRSLLAVCVPSLQSLSIFSLVKTEDKTVQVESHFQCPAISAVAIRATRSTVWDLLVVKPGNDLMLLTHGIRELPLELRDPDAQNDFSMDTDEFYSVAPTERKPTAVKDCVLSSVSVVFDDGSTARATIHLVPWDTLTCQCLHILAHTLPADESFTLHYQFLKFWSWQGFTSSGGAEFECFTRALFHTFGLGDEGLDSASSDPWLNLCGSASHDAFRDDPVFRQLERPPTAPPLGEMLDMGKPHHLLGPILNALHNLGEDLRLMYYRYESLMKLVPVISRIARSVRPEWADYWKRLCPGATNDWIPSSATVTGDFDDRLPVWPPDMTAILFGRINNPDWHLPWADTYKLAASFNVVPSFEYGRLEPLPNLRQLTALYICLADGKVTETRKRAENAIALLVRWQVGSEFLQRLSLGVAAPIREAARTCQLHPPGDWPVVAYDMIGRNDLAEGASGASDVLSNDGYRSVKDFLNSTQPRRTIQGLGQKAAAAGRGETHFVTGVELDLEDFTEIRFGQDRRLDEVARMLCSSGIPTIRLLERPELNEHDQAKEHQHHVVRIAEKTLALPYGRAMFTFGSVATREVYSIPKIEYCIRLLPQNVIIAPEPGKIVLDCTNWAEFHNGVAAGLRISPSSNAVDSSWIAFNKPSELSPEHAGFLFALGLTGHLKGMLTWDTFAYLTPKHELTSIGVLLGLAAANAGTGNRHVTKLLAVHTPALLPTPAVDLNVSLMTQAAGLAGIGLLYMGTSDRHMAEMLLTQISRKDLVQPDLSNEHREAYTLSAALAFGMVMLGKGSPIPADMELLSRLHLLIHGEPLPFVHRKQPRPSFDINLTSPAATIAIGLMYFKSERQEIADMLSIPDTVLSLSRIQPSFLLVRTLARVLIMWNGIEPKQEWLSAQVPGPITKAMESRFHGKPVDDAIELAYYNILAGCCFAIALKCAGTAREEAYLLIISYYDLFSRMAYTNVPAYDHKIKRSAIRDGLNLISLSLSMVMAGTGEINCLRRLRYAYGMHHVPIRYGTHVATHQSLGLLFLGGGRYTLGTSDAAIASMVVAFFPRFAPVSSDNKCYLQALRHLWVLAVEPRCLIARDVDTKEVVYLPVKIKVKQANGAGTAQLISPTLIPDLDNLLSIRVDTPRYWPFHLDIANIPRHRESLLRSRTLYVKRRTAFLSYMEDPKGSRSLFVRSGSSTGDAATLDFPQLSEVKMHPASDLNQFISSYSNDVFFLAFADHLCREEGVTDEEKLFHTYAHACLLDSILQDKPQTLQSHLTIYRYRTMSPDSRYFNLWMQDLRFATDFYNMIYDRRFSGRQENNTRPPLIRENTISGALHALDHQLDAFRADADFLAVLRRYVRGQEITCNAGMTRRLTWYLLRNCVPVSTILVVLKEFARSAHDRCMNKPEPQGTSNVAMLDRGIKEMLHETGTQMTTHIGTGWTSRSLDEIVEAWKN